MNPLAYWQQMSWGMAGLNCLPFILLLVLIAVLPFISFTANWWGDMRNKFYVAAVFAAIGVWLYSGPTGDFSKVWGTLLDYVAFLAIMGALFVVSGGIYISGAFSGLPYVNTLFLLLGAVLASLLGTTGASMILIRPLLRANQLRKHKAHIVVFFIFIVSNCGAVLIPLGPPLYLGFLRGVSFLWTFRLIPQWSLTIFVLLFLFHLIDDRIFDQEEQNMRLSLISEIKSAEKAVKIVGWSNVFYLLAILTVVLIFNYWGDPWLQSHYSEDRATVISRLSQAAIMSLLAFMSYKTTPRKVHFDNLFSFYPIVEVGVLFFGIFGAMVPTLALLEAKGKDIALSHPWQYFWMSGLLSSVLDNSPTYLSYVTLAAGQYGINPNHLGELAAKYPALLAAVSCGSSFMGANTYIGNGPNFMVKAIAEYSGVEMPSFGAYMLWSGAILIPTFILVTFVFFQ
ncbi:MAG TPA: sodium:proton antiporter [bacterium]